jgi:hypothetical protein
MQYKKSSQYNFAANTPNCDNRLPSLPSWREWIPWQEFIFSACFISLHPLKISFLCHPAALLRVRCVRVFPSRSPHTFSKHKTSSGWKSGRKARSALLSTRKNKVTLSQLIYLCVIIMSISVPPLSQIFICIRGRLGRC